MSDVEIARKQWAVERSQYEKFGELIAERVRVAVKASGIWAVITSRAKEPHSLVKKLLKKDKYSYETLPDKAGARCMVRYRSDVESVVRIVLEMFTCSQPDDKFDELLAKDQIGYISTHIDVRLKENDSFAVEFPPDKFWAELQIRTQGQHLWAEMSHDTFYKDEETLKELPEGQKLKRRITLMAGLIEVADQEFDRLNKEIPVYPALELYKDLERHYYKLTSKRPDKELSLEVIELLIPLYSEEIHQIANRIDEFVAQNEKTLNAIYDGADEWHASAFLYQPEALMLIERLYEDSDATRTQWNTRFPEEELERVANAFGLSFD